MVDSMEANPVLGLQTCIRLGLIRRIEEIRDERGGFVKINQDLFEGLGCFPQKVRIKLREGATPVARPPRRVPIAVKSRLQEALVKLEQEGIIERLEAPTEWISNLTQLLKNLINPSESV